jgi:4-amino-4-deoxy-L-arabinose transferase-like glycosyltransferase
MKTSRLQRLNRTLARRRTLTVIVILIASIIIRAFYYHDLAAGPLLRQHEWTQTDMNYFDRWARAVAAGDWLSRNVDPPLHRWMIGLAEEYYAKHPNERPPSAQNETEESAMRSRDLTIWKKWIGQGRFFQEPLYPYLIAITYRFLGEDVRYVFCWQMVLGVELNLLIYLVARRSFGDLAGVIAASIATAYSPLLLYELILLRDSTIAFMTMLLAWMFFYARRTNSTRRWSVYGLCCGVAMMLKSHFVIAIIVAAFWLMIRLRRNRSTLVRGLLALAASLLLGLSPMITRNLRLGIAPFAGAGNAAATVIITNAEDAGAAEWGLSHFGDLMSQGRGGFLTTFLATLRTHPSVGHYVELMWSKFDSSWRWYEQPSNENFYYYRMHSPTLRLLPMTYYFVASLGIVGLIMAASRIRRNWPAYLPVMINLPVLLIFFVQARYRIPLAAGVIPFAGLALSRIAVGFLNRDARLTSLIIVSVFLIMLWTGRALPQGMETIRPADFTAPYEYYYQPRIIAALKAGNKKEAVDIIEGALRYRPELIINFKPGSHARSADEFGMMMNFSQIYEFYSRILTAAGMQTEAGSASAFSAELSRAAQPSR